MDMVKASVGNLQKDPTSVESSLNEGHKDRVMVNYLLEDMHRVLEVVRGLRDKKTFRSDLINYQKVIEVLLIRGFERIRMSKGELHIGGMNLKTLHPELATILTGV